MKKLLILSALVLLSACSGKTPPEAINSFDECVAAGYQTEDDLPTTCTVENRTYNKPQQITL